MILLFIQGLKIMTNKVLAGLLFVVLIAVFNTGFAEKRKYPKLKPAEGPCLFLLDDEGNATNVVANPPCDLGGTIVNPGDTVDPAQIENYKKAKKASKSKAKAELDADSDGDGIPEKKEA